MEYYWEKNNSLKYTIATINILFVWLVYMVQMVHMSIFLLSRSNKLIKSEIVIFWEQQKSFRVMAGRRLVKLQDKIVAKDASNVVLS